MPRARNSIPILLFALAALLLAVAWYVSDRAHGSTGIDLYLHDTYYVVGQHTVLLFLSLYFGACGLVYYVCPRITHQQMRLLLAHLHFWLSLAFITVWFFAYHRFAANSTSPAVPADPLKSGLGLCLLSMLGLVTVEIILPINLIWSFFRGETILAAFRPF